MKSNQPTYKDRLEALRKQKLLSKYKFSSMLGVKPQAYNALLERLDQPNPVRSWRLLIEYMEKYGLDDSILNR